MTSSIKGIALLLFACISIFSFSSCDKEEDEGLLPNITIKTGAEYTTGPVTVAQGTPLKIGINASKAEDKDVLTKFTITRSYDGGTDATVYTEDLSGSKGDSYSYDYNFTTRTQAGTEKYTFTVVNRDGLINNLSVTVTVQ